MMGIICQGNSSVTGIIHHYHPSGSFVSDGCHSLGSFISENFSKYVLVP